MTANDSQTPGRIPAPATRPRSGAESQFGRVGIEFTSPNAGRVDDPARETCAPEGDPDTPGRRRSPFARSDQPSGRSIRSPVAALGAPAGSRVAPPPGLCRSGQEFLHDCGPYLGPPPAPGPLGLSHQRVILRTTWPAGDALRPGSTPYTAPRSRRPRRGTPPRRLRAPRRRWTILPDGEYARRRSAQRACHLAGPTTNPASSLLALSLGSQGSPAGWGPALDPDGPHGAARAVCMYDVAGAAQRPRDRRAHRATPVGQRSAK
jgi:hypothetical protein